MRRCDTSQGIEPLKLNKLDESKSMSYISIKPVSPYLRTLDPKGTDNSSKKYINSVLDQ